MSSMRLDARPHAGGPTAWLLAVRPKTLIAGVAPVLIGTAVAARDGAFHLPAALAALGGALLIQIGTNLANDYFDFRRGADGADRLGPTRVTQAGLISPAAVCRACVLAFALATLAGIYLLLRGGLPILMIGVTSILLGVLYTGGPRPLAYLGLGDLFAFLFFGPVAVAGTYYVQALSWSPQALLAGCAPGLFAAAILTVNNYRDLESDRRSGKRTLAVRLGPRFARAEYRCTLLGAAAIPPLLVAQTGAPAAILVATLACLLALQKLDRALRPPPRDPSDGARLNRLLATTGQLELAFSLLVGLGWVLG